MQKTTLIQLVSAQAMPNLLAAMALDPETIVHCCTPSMEKRSAGLARAYHAAGLRAEVRVERLSKMPQPAELKALVENLAAECTAPPVLNFTGGTKLMSLGAFAGALHKKMPSLYVDTEDGIFVDGATAPGFGGLFPGGDTSLSQVKRRLAVHTLAIANGCGRVTGGQEWKPFIELAELLLDDPALEEKCHTKADALLAAAPRNFQQAAAFWNRQLAQPVDLPEPALELGTLSGLFEKRGGAYGIHPTHLQAFHRLGEQPKHHEYFTAFNALKTPFAFFQGVWWEVAVMRWLDAQGLYRDLRWSASVGSRDPGGTDMEEDILGIDDVNLLYVSCKRGGHKAQLSRTLEDVNSSAQRIGGSHAAKLFAVCLPLADPLKTRVNNRCTEIGIRLINRSEIRRGS